jgi:hypothetical protein
LLSLLFNPDTGSDKARNQNEAALLTARFMLVYCLTYTSTLKMEALWSPKRQLTFNGLHGYISHTIELFNDIIILITAHKQQHK